MIPTTRPISPRATGLALPLMAVLAFNAHGASAASLSFTTGADSNTVLGTQSDPQGPATSGSLTSLVTVDTGATIDFTGRPYATAVADAAGHSSVVADGNFPSGNQFNSLTATASITQQFTNSSGANQNFLYDFSILGPTLALSDYAGLAAGDANPPLSAYYTVDISVDHGLGAASVWSSTGTLTGGRLGYELTTGGTNPLTGSLFGAGTNTFGFNFTGANGSISDIALSGETITITSTLIAGMTGPGFEVGGRATIGDPNNQSLGSGFSGTLTAVPVPATVWLLGSGTLGLLGFARRRGEPSTR